MKNSFTYWENGDEAFVHHEGICDCCQKTVKEYHITKSKWWCGWNEYIRKSHITKSKWWYGWKEYIRKSKIHLERANPEREEYELHLCYDCIALGLAARKFRLKLNWVVNPSDEYEVIGREEVETKTPTYRKQTKDSWPVHCGEACVYLEGYACDIDCFCHEFRCRVCGQNISEYEQT